MSAVVLAVDVGNTRVKWGMHDGTTWLKQAWIETTRVAELKSEFSAQPMPRQVIVSNVAGPALRIHLNSVLPRTLVAHWIKSESTQCGVRNTYADPAQLGCDRWAAMIGAHRLFAGPLLVVNAGTALTVDALAADGTFGGGTIAPGVELMVRALAANTAALRLQPGKFSTFPVATGDAIVSGAINAMCGAIERMARFLEQAGHAAPRCILSGGGADLLAPHLGFGVKVVENLVLEGLISIAREIAQGPLE